MGTPKRELANAESLPLENARGCITTPTILGVAALGKDRARVIAVGGVMSDGALSVPACAVL